MTDQLMEGLIGVGSFERRLAPQLGEQLPQTCDSNRL